MPRAIDKFPTPTHVRPKKLIVTAKSRTGTFSLYQALQTLGYRPYHMYEVVSLGVPHMSVLEEALNAKYFGIGKPYGKAEFEKWFADYDTIIEITQFFLPELVECYPDAQYIHMERDIDAWYLSLDKTGGEIFGAVKRFPLRQLTVIDAFVDKFCSLHLILEKFWCRGGVWDDKRTEEVCRAFYIATNDEVRKFVPENQLAIFRLEDGFGWEEICPFLGKPVPDVSYPRGNAPKEFHGLVKMILAPAFRKAIALGVTFVLVPAIGAAVWYYKRR